MGASTPVSKDSPLWRAWEAYAQTEDYANTKRWAIHAEHTEGSLWAAFERGFAATTPTPARSEAAGGEESRVARAFKQMHEDREALGKIVRAIWMAWAREQPNPKPSWLVPWERLSEPDREVDRRIGHTIADLARREMRQAAEKEIASLRQQLAAAREDGERTKAALRRAAVLIDDLSDDDECSYDHHGYCQTHRLGMRPCENERARTWLRQHAARTEPAREGGGREMREDHMLALFLLAGIEVKRAHRLPNQYCSDTCCADRPWWLVETPFGVVRIGWRKRVIHIDWASTDVRGIVTEDDCTKDDMMVHAWGYAAAVRHLQSLALMAARSQPAIDRLREGGNG